MSITPQERAERSVAAMRASDRVSKALGMRIAEIAPGRAVVSMQVVDSMLNGHNICHGGYIFILADSAFAFACNSYNQGALAQHCTISYLRQVRRGDILTATATEVSRGGRNGIYDIVVTNPSGEAMAQFRGHSRTIKQTHFDEDET
ncbi:MAG: hydroxyphenylacetyl-CoA thioesterase PaaI [Rhodobacteraceae bacterium]|nr:hydroxyphenylacetyl-CoA thioesterase PaaI [Paracoccaceae bacterium]